MMGRYVRELIPVLAGLSRVDGVMAWTMNGKPRQPCDSLPTCSPMNYSCAAGHIGCAISEAYGDLT